MRTSTMVRFWFIFVSAAALASPATTSAADEQGCPTQPYCESCPSHDSTSACQEYGGANCHLQACTACPSPSHGEGYYCVGS